MNGHPTREEDFDLFALGVLEGDEKQTLETHLAACTECTKRLAEARGRIALLALAAPPVAPSPAVKTRLLEQIRETERASAGPGRELQRTTGILGRWGTAVLVPVGVALAVVSAVLWTENRRLDQDLAALRGEMQLQQQNLQQARQFADLITAPDTILVPLAAQPHMPKGAAHVMYNQKMAILMYEGELDPAPSDKSYQLWLVPTQGNPISAGVFTPASDKTSHFLMKLPEGVTAKAFAVTLEPSGGRRQPTGPMVLVGPVS